MDKIPTKDDPFWFQDYSILFNSERLIEFVPLSDMADNEKLNAAARLSIYLGILLSIIYGYNYLFIAIIGLLLTYFVYHNSDIVREEYSNDDDGDGAAPTGVDGNGNVFQKPTKDNPFMNVLLTDYLDNPNRPAAGNIEDPNVIADVNKNFNFGLYKDVDDVWDRNNSQREYVSNPATTIPNDRASFMNWCWKVPYVCKSGDLLHCLHGTGVRRHSRIR